MVDIKRDFTNVGLHCVVSETALTIGCVIDAASQTRLLVDAEISAGSITIIPPRYRLKTIFNVTDIQIAPSVTTNILSQTFSGQLDFIAVRTNDLNSRINIISDGITSSSILLDDLLNQIGIVGNSNDQFYTNLSGNNDKYVEIFPNPIDFLSSLAVEVTNEHSATITVVASLFRLRQET